MSPSAHEGATPTVVLHAVEDSRYVIGYEIARGGMGRVLLARDIRLDRQVAIKKLLSPNPGNVRRFEREALLTARLQHPSIINVYEACRFSDGEPFYAMKHVDGRRLDGVIAEARTFDQRLALLPHLIAVAEALAYAHTSGSCTAISNRKTSSSAPLAKRW